MQGIDVRSRHHHLDRRTQTQLADFSAYVRWVWPSLPDPRTIQWSDRLLLALDGEVPWIFGPADQDPLRATGGATVVPRRAMGRLKRIARSGVPFQHVAIAHELNRDGPVRQVLPALQSGPRTCTDEVARALVGEVPTHPWVARTTRVLHTATIFGIIAPQPPRHGEFCLWYPLTAWRW
jgi:hypothetical protein